MITLILVFCLASDATSCVEKRPAIGDLSFMGCQLAAQPMAQEWLRKNPDYVLKRATCGFGSARQEHA